MIKLFSAVFLLLFCGNLSMAQVQSPKKYYNKGISIGDAILMEEWAESDGKQSSAVYVVDIKSPGRFYFKTITNMQKGMQQLVTDNGRPTSLVLTAATDGWQLSAAQTYGGAQPLISLTEGRHIIRLTIPGNVPPLNDVISLNRSSTTEKLDADWQKFSSGLNKMMAERPLTDQPADKSNPAEANKVLGNPEGTYEHAVDESFSYSTNMWVSLTAGVSYTFSTYSSTKDPVLHLFDPTNVDQRSWSNDDGGGGYESSLTVVAPVTGVYILLARPYWAGQSGITNIKQNGVNLVTNTPIAGQRYSTTTRTGNLNYFTCRLGGSDPDTRIFTLTGPGTAVTGYNDDYFNTTDGEWEWDFASRIKKNYTTGSSIVYVCAFRATTTGTCDVYMGNGNGTLPVSDSYEFPLFKAEDAIQSAPSSGVYNCISWSGGITNDWSWPTNPLSSWHVDNDELAGFDKFYANNPVRYPGAWTYTRIFANSSNNCVDLWKANGHYTHASVTKPGNDHPHGYDWESKPGSFDRQFHPRNALENPNCYGVVTDYYKATGFVASKNVNHAFATDAEAVAAGVAVYENAKLSIQAKVKLDNFLIKTGSELKNTFEQLYESWKKTWAAKAFLSDPYAYCNNKEFELLLSFCNKNNPAVLPLVFEKFTAGEHLTSKLLWELTRGRYAALLDEAKRDIENNPYDTQGRFKIHGDHDNGVRYIEKILQQLEINSTEPAPADPVISFTVTASPVPVKDVLTITITLKEESRLSVTAVSSRTGNNRLLQQETTKGAGIYQYQLNKNAFAGTAGDVIIVQVKVNGVMQAIKALVGN